MIDIVSAVPLYYTPPESKFTPESVRACAEVSALLRRPGDWPEGFEWNYCHADKCALGLGEHLGYDMHFLINTPAGDTAFRLLHHTLGISPRHVQPYQVADALDKQLAEYERGHLPA